MPYLSPHYQICFCSLYLIYFSYISSLTPLFHLSPLVLITPISYLTYISLNSYYLSLSLLSLSLSHSLHSCCLSLLSHLSVIPHFPLYLALSYITNPLSRNYLSLISILYDTIAPLFHLSLLSLLTPISPISPLSLSHTHTHTSLLLHLPILSYRTYHTYLSLTHFTPVASISSLLTHISILSLSYHTSLLKMYCMYTKPVSDIIPRHGLYHHSYADDTQLYMPMDHSNNNWRYGLPYIQLCVSEIKEWINQNMLNLNDDKTEFIVFTSNHKQDLYNDLSIMVGDTVVDCSSQVKDHAVIFDRMLSLRQHVSHTSKLRPYQVIGNVETGLFR